MILGGEKSVGNGMGEKVQISILTTVTIAGQPV